MENTLNIGLKNRNYNNIKSKFIAFLLPALATELGAALNEFVDGILVANLIDLQALSVVNLGSSIYYLYITINFLLGGGGATIYSVLLGKHDKESADKIFSASIITSVIVSLSIMILGLIFLRPIADFIAGESGLNDQLFKYLRYMFMVAPPFIVTMTYIFFLPTCGHPILTTTINLTANTINLCLDYVYIKIFGMGVEAAALATFTGFLVGFLILLGFHLWGKNMPRLTFNFKIIKSLKEICSTGLSSSSTFIGLTARIAICNLIAAKYAGQNGIIAFTICMQLYAIAYVFFGGVIDTLTPFMGVFHGGRDKNGIYYTIKLSAKLSTIMVVIIVAIFEIVPQMFLGLYSVTDANAINVVIPAIRIVSLVMLLCWTYSAFSKMTLVIGMKVYSFVISIVDGFVFILPCSLILCPFFGIYGMWWSFVISSFLMIIGVVITNLIVLSKRKDKYESVLLVPKNDDILIDVSINDEATIPSISSDNRILEIVKAMFDYVKNVNMDVLVQTNKDELYVDFRTIDQPYKTNEENKLVGFDKMYDMAKEVKYDYALGMNCTRVILDK